jgi:1,4-dihydroxy-2-naphthoyl-CoA hydrolase
MSIWYTPPDLEAINRDLIVGFTQLVGIRFTEIGDDHLVATMPVTASTRQPAGILHGGASVTLAETVGSVGATLCVDFPRVQCVGQEINANHLRAVRDGLVTARGVPLHLGSRSHVWQIELRDSAGRLSCVSRITMAIISPR